MANENKKELFILTTNMFWGQIGVKKLKHRKVKSPKQLLFGDYSGCGGWI